MICKNFHVKKAIFSRKRQLGILDNQEDRELKRVYPKNIFLEN